MASSKRDNSDAITEANERQSNNSNIEDTDKENTKTDDGPSSSKKSKSDPQAEEQSWASSYRRVIAILPGTGKGTLNNDVESSDDEDSDARSEGVIETSSSSSGIEEGIPHPTKPKVVVKRSDVDQSQASHG